jgi:cathepsin B
MKVLLLLAFLAAALVGVSALAPYGDRLREIAAQVNSIEGNTWVAGENARFTTADSFDSIKGLMGTRRDPSRRLPPREVKVPAALPSNFDARSAWPECASIAHIRDQSACGSCWAFGCVEAASDRVCIETKGADQPTLSARNLLSCSTNGGSDGCGGGFPDSAWQYLTTTGVVTGGDYGDDSLCQMYPFPQCSHHESGKYPDCPAQEYNTPECLTTCDKNSTYNGTYTSATYTFATAYSISDDVDQIRTEILTNGPVEATFDVYEDFLTYKSGVYTHQSGDLVGGHAVRFIGWGTLNGVDYWLVANSWNEYWGDNGLFMIKRGVDECGIEDDISAGLYKKSSMDSTNHIATSEVQAF